MLKKYMNDNIGEIVLSFLLYIISFWDNNSSFYIFDLDNKNKIVKIILLLL